MKIHENTWAQWAQGRDPRPGKDRDQERDQDRDHDQDRDQERDQDRDQDWDQDRDQGLIRNPVIRNPGNP